MGLLSKLSAWIAERSGGAETEKTEQADDDGDPGADSDTEETEADSAGSTLDPSAATETRTPATDDAVDALRDVRRSQETPSAGNDTDENKFDESDRDGAAGDPGGQASSRGETSE